MNAFNLSYAKQWVKTSETPFAKLLQSIWFTIKAIEVPNIPFLFKFLYLSHVFIKQVLADFLRIFYFTPLFKSRLENQPKGLYLYGGLPVVLGALNISMGNKVRLAGMTTLSGRTVSKEVPQLIIGDNVGIAWRTSISVGSKVVLGNNVRIAGDCYLAGYPGHPVDAKKRAQGAADTDSQVGDIILADDVWLASGVKVMPGVKIGEGTIVAAGSVVTKDLPSFVLAGGAPAKVIKSLKGASHE